MLTRKSWRKGSRGAGENGTNSLNHGTLYAGDWSVLDFRVTQVMGEIVSAAQLINRSAGGIYLCLRQSCWEMGTVKWESTACSSSSQLPSGHFTPATLLSKAACEEKLINIKQVECCFHLPSAFRHNSWGHFNVFHSKTPLSHLSCWNSLQRYSLIYSSFQPLPVHHSYFKDHQF